MGGTLGPVGATLAAGAVAVSAAAAVALGPLALALPVAAVAGVALLREPMALLTLYVWVGLYKDQSVVAS